MKEEKTVCPIIDTEIAQVLAEKIQPTLDYLRTNDHLPENHVVFPVGTLTDDGRLDLCKQNLGFAGAEMIVDALKENNWVKHLLLGTNKIGNEGAKMLSETIRNNQALETLYLGCNHIEAEGAIALCAALEENTHIKSLWFKRNPLGKTVVPALIQLLKKNPFIRTLDLVNTCLEDGFYDFFDYLAENTSVERLYLSGNYLKPSHISHLSEALAKNKTLKALFLSVNHFGDEGAENLAKGLAKNAVLQELSLASCGIAEKGMMALLSALWHHKTLIYLDVGYANSTRVLQSQANEISDTVAEKLCEFVAQSPQIAYLNVARTNLSEKYKANFSPYAKNYPIHTDSKAIKSVYR